MHVLIIIFASLLYKSERVYGSDTLAGVQAKHRNPIEMELVCIYRIGSMYMTFSTVTNLRLSLFFFNRQQQQKKLNRKKSHFPYSRSIVLHQGIYIFK